MKAIDLYHTGLVVDDFDGTMAWFTETAGYEWCDSYAGDIPVVADDSETTIPLRLVYSKSEPRLELLQTIPGTIWVPADSGVHHLGYWSDDVDADVATLTAGGMSVEVRAPLPDGSSMWAYCKGSSGPRIEFVSRSLEPALRQMFES